MKGVSDKFFKLTITMKNLLKVSALFFAVALASCESKPATETTTTTETSATEATTPAATDTTGAAAAPATTEAPAATNTEAPAATGEQK